MAKKIDKKVSKKIPTKNYVIALIVILLVVGITFYIFQWVDVLNKEKLSKSYLISTNTIVYEINDIEELNDVFLEMPNEYFVYISYNDNQEIYDLEKELKPLIEDYGLKDYFYYINVTNMKDKDNYLQSISSALNIEEDSIKKIPTIIMFRDKKIVKDGIVKREDENMISAADFEKLLEIKEIKKISR